MDLVAHQIGGAPPVWIDVAVVCPISTSPTVMANRAAGTACALRDAEATKRRKYGAAAQEAGATFVPFALDTFGRRGKDAREFFAGLAKKTVARQTGHPQGLLAWNSGAGRDGTPPPHAPTNRSAYAALMTKWTRRMACCLQIQNAVLIQQRRATALNRFFRRTTESDASPDGVPQLAFSLATGPGLNPLADRAYWSSDSNSSGF
mmetsp:Transcript_25574/g.40219  ORF Transcript_25574/g.40219 Transcript_25574/m.40219 type:complete len:205 (+) Transcript_25574:789-1403(+)